MVRSHFRMIWLHSMILSTYLHRYSSRMQFKMRAPALSGPRIRKVSTLLKSSSTKTWPAMNSSIMLSLLIMRKMPPVLRRESTNYWKMANSSFRNNRMKNTRLISCRTSFQSVLERLRRRLLNLISSTASVTLRKVPMSYSATKRSRNFACPRRRPSTETSRSPFTKLTTAGTISCTSEMTLKIKHLSRSGLCKWRIWRFPTKKSWQARTKTCSLSNWSPAKTN